MEPIFTIPYSEFKVDTYLERLLKQDKVTIAFRGELRSDGVPDSVISVIEDRRTR